MSCSIPISLFRYLFLHECGDVYGVVSEPWDYSYWAYLFLFAFSTAFEIPIYYAFLRKRVSFFRSLWISFVVNLATHPLVCLVFPLVFSRIGANEAQCLLFSEVFAPVVEAILLYRLFRMPLRLSIAASVCANLFSWLVGGYVFWFLATS